MLAQAQQGRRGTRCCWSCVQGALGKGQAGDAHAEEHEEHSNENDIGQSTAMHSTRAGVHEARSQNDIQSCPHSHILATSWLWLSCRPAGEMRMNSEFSTCGRARDGTREKRLWGVLTEGGGWGMVEEE